MQRIRDWLDELPTGVVPLVFVTAALLASAYLLATPPQTTDATLRLWTFSPNHYNTYLSMQSTWNQLHPDTPFDVTQVHMQAVTTRLRAAMWADLDVPDLVEVEITPAGTFFRGPVDQIGFVDLKPYLIESGVMDRIVQSRLLPYTHKGRIFGLPHDVHPVMLAYRRDLFEEEGIDPDSLDTWDKFIAAGREVVRRSRERVRRGEGTMRYMIILEDDSANSFETLLYQAGGSWFDAQGNLTMDSDIAFQVLLFLIPLIAGEDRIATNPGWGSTYYESLTRGRALSTICPDWRAAAIEFNTPGPDQANTIHGRMAMMPLPAFEPGGRRTSTWGGTMLGITRQCENPDLAWKLAQHLYMNPQKLAEAFEENRILPPFKDAWDHPVYRKPIAFWSDQAIGQQYIDLTEQMPEIYASPFLQMAKNRMGQVIAGCKAHYERHGDNGFEAYARQRLDEAAAYVRFQIARNPF